MDENTLAALMKERETLILEWMQVLLQHHDKSSNPKRKPTKR
jgi:hypothetical protein